MPDVAAPPTLEQLLNLADRAEHKGGLTAPEAARLRTGLRYFDDHHPRGLPTPAELTAAAVVDGLLRRAKSARKLVWKWERALKDVTTRADTAGADTEARNAITRVTALAQRWSHIPAKRAAATAVLDAITNRETE
jgi:hypothetical protein